MKGEYVWERFYAAAVLETDDVKLQGQIENAKSAINFRLRELVLDGNDPKERQAIEHALHGLKLLREERCQAADFSKS